MGTIEIARTVPAPPEQVFAAVSDLRGYGRDIPLTAIEADPGPIGVGWTFVGRSGVGALRLPDRMRVTEWDPPRSFAVVKLGPVLEGWAQVHLTPEADGTRVIWREHITPRPVSLLRHLDPVTDRFNRWMFGRAVDRMVRRACGG